MRFKSETEALVYQDGVPAQGMERNHDEFIIADPARGGETVDLYIECGVNTFFWGGWGVAGRNRVCRGIRWIREMVRRCRGGWAQCDLAVINPVVHGLGAGFGIFAQPGKSAAGEVAAEAADFVCGTNQAANARWIRITWWGRRSKRGEILSPIIATRAGGSAARCFAVGHAHIDTAWLWPVRETIRKAARTFSTQIGLMREYPDYIFMASQRAALCVYEGTSAQVV